jgi:C-terminal processing protease CtpA/Prc
MRRNLTLAVFSLAFLVALPAFAGGKDGKCTASTQECLDMMAVKMKSSGFVGIELDSDKTTGTYSVKKVIPGTPAESAGLLAGDVLYALNGVVLAGAKDEDMMKARKEWKPGQTVTYTVKRDGKAQDVSLTLAAWPADHLAKYIGEHMIQHASVETASSEAKN